MLFSVNTNILPKENQGAQLTLQELLNLKLVMKHNLYVTVVNLTDVIFHAAMQLKGHKIKMKHNHFYICK